MHSNASEYRSTQQRLHRPTPPPALPLDLYAGDLGCSSHHIMRAASLFGGRASHDVWLVLMFLWLSSCQASAAVFNVTVEILPSALPKGCVNEMFEGKAILYPEIVWSQR